MDCGADVRRRRLLEQREQPELASEHMERWAAYLRGKADALALPVRDTGDMECAAVADAIEATLGVNRLSAT